MVERLPRRGRSTWPREAPPLDFGADEIGQVGQAFNEVQETAVRVAVEQAELRRSVRDVFLSLARRSQALLHRQLGLLDAMERRETDAEELDELFRVDHLATRMRRNAENLIVLSGATAGRAWRKPVPMVDVLRGALAEVEDYTRVTRAARAATVALAGRAVGDVIHLLAELIENAVSFSPPHTRCRSAAQLVGARLRHRDRGPRPGHEPRRSWPRPTSSCADPPEFNLTSTARLGLYVVGQLAERHGIRVRLKRVAVRRHDRGRAAARTSWSAEPATRARPDARPPRRPAQAARPGHRGRRPARRRDRPARRPAPAADAAHAQPAGAGAEPAPSAAQP